MRLRWHAPVRSRPKPAAGKPGRSAPRARSRAPWPAIGSFLDGGYGQITLGAIPYSSLRHTAIANDGHNMLMALVRRPGETLHDLLSRLDRALPAALEEQEYVSELESPRSGER